MVRYQLLKRNLFCLPFTADANFDEHLEPPHHKDGGEDDSVTVRAEDDSTERVEDELDGLHGTSPVT